MKFLPKLPWNNKSLAGFLLFEGCCLFFSESGAQYLLIFFTTLCILSTENKWKALLSQFIFIFFFPAESVRALLFGASYIVFEKNKALPIKASFIFMTALYILMLNFEEYQIKSMFPGLIAMSAVIYYITRVGKEMHVIQNGLPAVTLGTVGYIVYFLSLPSSAVIKPVYTLPADLVQLATAGVIYYIIKSLMSEKDKGADIHGPKNHENDSSKTEYSS